MRWLGGITLYEESLEGESGGVKIALFKSYLPGVLPLGHADTAGQAGPSSPQACLIPSFPSSIPSIQEDVPCQTWLLIGQNTNGLSVCDIISALIDVQ